MATLDMVMSQIVGQVESQLESAGLTGVTVGEGWPGDDAVQDVRGGGKNLVSVSHRMTTNLKKWTKFRRARTDMPCGIASALNHTNLPGLSTSQLTISLASGCSAVNRYDTVSLVAQFGIQSDAAMYIAGANETLTSMAAGLAAAINAQSLLGSWVSATAVGAVVTVTSKLSHGGGLTVSTLCANSSNFSVTVGSALSSIQITVWADTIDNRYSIINPLQSFLQGFEGRWSFALANGENVSLKLKGARELDADRQKDLFDWFFLLDVEYYVDIIDPAYKVLAPITNVGPLT